MCNDSVIRSAITLRSLLTASRVVPPQRARRRGGRRQRGRGAADGAAWVDAFRAAAAARTSCLRIRPPTPVPEIEPRSTPCSAAILRTNGVTYPPLSPEGAVATGAGGCRLARRSDRGPATGGAGESRAVPVVPVAPCGAWAEPRTPGSPRVPAAGSELRASTGSAGGAAAGAEAAHLRRTDHGQLRRRLRRSRPR